MKGLYISSLIVLLSSFNANAVNQVNPNNVYKVDGLYYYIEMCGENIIRDLRTGGIISIRREYCFSCYSGSDQNPYDDRLQDWTHLSEKYNTMSLSSWDKAECARAVNANMSKESEQ